MTKQKKKELKKACRKRLEAGADVKEELQYIDIVRKVERAGDCIYEISKKFNFRDYLKKAMFLAL